MEKVNLREFHLTLAQLSDICHDLCNKILKSLSHENQEIKALPTYLRRSIETISGDAVVLDTGGTNIRAGRIRVQGPQAKLLAGPFFDQDTMQKGKLGQISGDIFFANQAELVAKSSSDPEICLGYCFSYPINIRPDGNARLLKWTKGINIPNVVGTLIGSKIRIALLENGKKLKKFAILNDTVASLLAGAWIAPECTHYIGLIVGTGTNMAGFFPVGHITKLSAEVRGGWLEHEDMAINLESGNFSPPHLTEFDQLLDDSAPDDNPGSQRFEKAVSGAYLPKLFGIIIGRNTCLRLTDGFDPEGPEAHPGLIARLKDYPGIVGEAATAVLNRSADLVAAALAGLIQSYGPGQQKVGILAEGAVFWQTPGYRNRVENTLASLVSVGTTTKILHCSGEVDANFLGAALAALSSKKEI